MSSYTYRDATADDAAAIAAFGRENWAATFANVGYSPEDLAAYLNKSFSADIQRAEIGNPELRYRLAFDAEGLVGFCLMGVQSLPVDEPRSLELHRLYVAERAKGAGVANTLMEDCIAWARAHDASALYLSVWENNFRAQRFYRRWGFADFSEWDFMVGKTADRDLIWRLAL